jgi:hypothetical protein
LWTAPGFSRFQAFCSELGEKEEQDDDPPIVYENLISDDEDDEADSGSTTSGPEDEIGQPRNEDFD